MKSLLAISLLLILQAGCASSLNAITDSGEQLQLRNMQTREYATLDKQDVLRSILATLQDLGFVIDEADSRTAMVSATKFDSQEIRMTVTVRERSGGRLAVRANASVDQTLVDEPGAYQDFFNVLDHAVFLTLHKVD